MKRNKISFSHWCIFLGLLLFSLAFNFSLGEFGLYMVGGFISLLFLGKVFVWVTTSSIAPTECLRCDRPLAGVDQCGFVCWSCHRDLEAKARQRSKKRPVCLCCHRGVATFGSGPSYCKDCVIKLSQSCC